MTDEEKLYAVKNANGIYLSYSDDKHYRWREYWREGQLAVTTSQRIAHDLCTQHGGHVVTLVEEPKKVVLSKEQAEIVKCAHGFYLPARYISINSGEDEEELLMNAYVNGYTVAKDKKYVVYKNLGGKHNTDVVQYAQAYRSSAHSETLSWTITSWILNDEDTSGSSFQFTEAEIEHYGLQDCEKEGVTDDEV